jgi:hypothetical protein
VFCSHYWKNNPEGESGNLITTSLKEVTKIEVYNGAAFANKGAYIICIVFYNGDTILGAPVAGGECNYTIDNIKANFIDKN